MNAPSDPSAKTSRRGLFLGLGGLVAVAAGWQVWLGRRSVTFEPVPGLPGWRQMSGRVTGGSAANAIFAGIGETNTPAPIAPDKLRGVLYRESGAGLPAAIFTDVNCPNCARLEAKLLGREGLSITWHDLPLLAPSSEVAARAMIAGELQGRPEFRERVRATAPGRLNTARLTQMAEADGLDALQLLRDMDGSAVTDRLTLTKRAADTLGAWGTPGLTIGQTFVLGDVSSDILDQIIAFERARA